MKREVRFIKGAQIRAKKGDKQGIEGYAAVFNKRSVNLGWFFEEIKPGAFSRAISEKQDVRCLMNHDANLLLGRTKSGTLELREDTNGLYFDDNTPDTQNARDLHELLARGDVDGCSFSFQVMKQAWREERQADGTMLTIREIEDLDLFDVGPVTFPAYPDTSVDSRSLFPEGMPEDVLKHLPKEERERLARADKKTKKVAGVDLTSDCFAFVGDANDTSTWKLPIKFPGDEEKTKSHIRNALSRFGQTKGIPADQKDKVWKKIVAAAKKHDIKVSEENSRRAMEAGATESSPNTCDCECGPCTSGDCASCDSEECTEENCDHGQPVPEEGISDAERARMKMRLDLAMR
jgi:HK97 family phage prohead protease